MKKSLIALAALAAVGASLQAQAQVSVYGRLDAGYASTTATDNKGVDTKATGIQSHNSVSSFWGIQGSEDLGSGMKANFKLEQDVYIANGNTGSSGANGGVPNNPGFNRTSLVGISGAFGRLDFGRDYTPTFKLISATDINGLSRVSTVQLAGTTGSGNAGNLLFYSTPDISGFKANLAYGGVDGTKSSDSGDTSTKFFDLSATYTWKDLFVGLGAGSTEKLSNGFGDLKESLFNLTYSDGAYAAAVPADATKYIAGSGVKYGARKQAGNALVASYDFGVAKVAGNIINTEITLQGDAKIKGNEINVGVTVPVEKFLLKAQIGSQSVKQDNVNDITGTDFVLGADYNLSPKTAVFITTGNFNKLTRSDYQSDAKVTSTAIGVKTVF